MYYVMNKKPEFTKYASIENHYQIKFLNKIPQEIKEQQWSADEKIDGSNLTIMFNPEGERFVGKRSGWLEEGESFFDVWNVLKKYEPQLNAMKMQAQALNQTIKLRGELYGTGVQKRLDYGPEKYIKIFDIEINGELLSPAARELYRFHYYSNKNL